MKFSIIFGLCDFIKTQKRLEWICTLQLPECQLLARNKHNIWNLGDCNWPQIHNRPVSKQTLNHLAKLPGLAKWLNVCQRTKWLCVRDPLQSPKLFSDFKTKPIQKKNIAFSESTSTVKVMLARILFLILTSTVNI